MKVKMLKELALKGKHAIPKGAILKVRQLPGQALALNRPYQIIDGTSMGEVIPLDYCMVLTEEKTYTEKQWNDMENHYMKLLDTERENVIKLQTEKNEFLKSFGDIIKLASVSSEVSSMLNSWLNAEYEGSEEVDRMNFSLKLTKFIQEKLV